MPEIYAQSYAQRAPYSYLFRPNPFSASYCNHRAPRGEMGFADLSLGPLGYRAKTVIITKLGSPLGRE